MEHQSTEVNNKLNGYEKRAQRKRATIIKAAQDLFARQGVTEVSITDIADKANVSRVTLFKYFGDKETLAREAMCTWVERLMQEYDAILTGERPFHEKLLALLSTKLAGREKIGEQFIQSAAWNDPTLIRLIKEISARQSLPKINQLLEEGKCTGAIDPDLDNEAIMVYFSAFSTVIINPDYIRKGKAFQQSLFHLFMGGLIKDWYQISRVKESLHAESSET